MPNVALFILDYANLVNHRITKRNQTSAPSPFVGSGTGLRLKCKMTCTYNMENTVVSREWLLYVAPVVLLLINCKENFTEANFDLQIW